MRGKEKDGGNEGGREGGREGGKGTYLQLGQGGKAPGGQDTMRRESIL